MGFPSVGQNVLISSKASIYGASRIKIGDNVRIDDFCVLSAGRDGIVIGSNVHIAVYSLLIGAAEIVISDFAGLSSRVSVYSSSDDYSGWTMTNPTIPDNFKNLNHASVFIGRHVIVGSGSVILPGVRIEEGAAIGALSMVSRDCESFGIYSGNPARKVKDRQRHLLSLEKEFLRVGNS
ncbi:acyltransferase [Ideonella paludis]|nr:acyltransferase [Ideonella paludis]